VEVACGTGQGLGYLASVSGTFEAGDYSERILSIARRYYNDRVVLRQFDAQELPFDNQSKDVIILFEAIYYIPDAKRFVMECRRVLRPGGIVLIATANKDLYDFNPSPHSYRYFNAVELNGMFDQCGFDTDFFGDTPVQQVSLRQRIFRPVKKLAVNLGIMPKTTMGKKWLKRLVFGKLITMPPEIGPQSGQIGNDEGKIYKGYYVKPEKISSSGLNKTHKVIYCLAKLRSSNGSDGNQ
jgi:ubiquinone/menaquinone biosynthesis C-methylase UbiE